MTSDELHTSSRGSIQKNSRETVKGRRPSSVLIAQANVELNTASSNTGSHMYNSTHPHLPSPRRKTFPDPKFPFPQNTSQNNTNNNNNTNNLISQVLVNQLMTQQPTPPPRRSPKKNNNTNNLSQSPPSYILRKQSHTIIMNNIKFASAPSSPTSPNNSSSSFSFPFSRQTVSRPLPANRPRSYARIVKDESSPNLQA